MLTHRLILAMGTAQLLKSFPYKLEGLGSIPRTQSKKKKCHAYWHTHRIPVLGGRERQAWAYWPASIFHCVCSRIVRDLVSKTTIGSV